MGQDAPPYPIAVNFAQGHVLRAPHNILSGLNATWQYIVQRRLLNRPIGRAAWCSRIINGNMTPQKGSMAQRNAINGQLKHFVKFKKKIKNIILDLSIYRAYIIIDYNSLYV